MAYSEYIIVIRATIGFMQGRDDWSKEMFAN